MTGTLYVIVAIITTSSSLLIIEGLFTSIIIVLICGNLGKRELKIHMELSPITDNYTRYLGLYFIIKQSVNPLRLQPSRLFE
jgi:hypothetical protein